jgi:hypothetical protein
MELLGSELPLVAYWPEPDDWPRPSRRVKGLAARRAPQHTERML